MISHCKDNGGGAGLSIKEFKDIENVNERRQWYIFAGMTGHESSEQILKIPHKRQATWHPKGRIAAVNHFPD